MGAYIQSSSSITRHDTFARENFAKDLINRNSKSVEIIQPDYKKYINPALLRRTPLINRMALACVADCESKVQAGLIFDGIILGTGLGCLKGTEKFLSIATSSSKESLLPPTAFIQSGHNAIAGQIALDRKNHGYNMTHVHGALSFEYALMDALLLLKEGRKNILVGAVDEKIELLTDMAKELKVEEPLVSEFSAGASFFIVDGTKKPKDNIRVIDVSIIEAGDSHKLENILEESNADILFLSHHLEANALNKTSCVYTDICGQYWSSSAFGLHLAADFLTFQKDNKTALIVNIGNNNQIGLTKIRRE